MWVCLAGCGDGRVKLYCNIPDRDVGLVMQVWQQVLFGDNVFDKKHCCVWTVVRKTQCNLLNKFGFVRCGVNRDGIYEFKRDIIYNLYRGLRLS